jgi:hypothetical protein
VITDFYSHDEVLKIEGARYARQKTGEPAIGPSDLSYRWGGAVCFSYNDVASVGPGFDNLAIKWQQRFVVPRRGGQLYVEGWQKLLALLKPSRPWMVHVETWNEYHEGTNVSDSREYGRQYIELTKLNTQLFRGL